MEKIAESHKDRAVNQNKTKHMIVVAPRRGPCVALFLVLLMYFISIGKLAAQEMTYSPRLSGHVSVLIDGNSKLSFDDILHGNYQGEFKPIASSTLNIGFKKAAIWVKLSIPSESSWEGFLSVTPNYLDFVDIFVARPGRDQAVSDFVKYEAGDHRPLLMNGLSGIDPAVAVSFSQRKITTVYVHVVNLNSATQLNLNLDVQQNNSQDSVFTGLLYGTWFGGMTILLLTQLVFYFFSRKPEYPLLAFSTLGVIMIYFGNLGLSHIYLFKGAGTGNDAFIGVSAWAGLAASALAYMQILNLRRYAPKVRFFYLFTAFCGIVGVGFALTGNTVVFGPFGSILSILGVFVTVLCSLYLVNKEGTSSKLRAAAFCTMGVGATLTMLQRLGVQWLPNWTLHAYGGAILLQTLLLTGALAVRLRDLEIKNHKLHKDALRQARTAERSSARLVEERTKELVKA
ncbi:7TM-DISM domain-containing protein [Brucella sp. TWI559]